MSDATAPVASAATVPPSDDPARPTVGLVLGTEDSTPLRFAVALGPGESLQLDDVVVCDRVLPDGEIIRVAGVVDNVRASHEGTRFSSDVFLVESGILPAQTSEVAEVLTTRVEPEIYVPPLPGAAVRRAVGAEHEHALFFDQMEQRLPIGLDHRGEPLYANFDFVDGTRGAHVNISGISGVATKTTYATFLLYSMFNCGVLGREAANSKALIFNVKGEDLLFLDHLNARLKPVDVERYRQLGLPAAPFDSVAVYGSPRKGDPNAAPDIATRTLNTHTYYWTIAEFVEEELLAFLFADAEDERQQFTMVIHNVSARLKREGERVGDDGAWRIDDVTITTFADLCELICARVEDEATRYEWAGPATSTGSVHAFIRRLRSSQRMLGHLIRADIKIRPDHQVRLSDAKVTVVDLHNLHDRAKRFVVGTTIRQVFEQKEASGASRPLLFLVLDELNKYAPSTGDSPIKEILLDVAERGRSLGVILIGAQQTASEVERRIIANSSIRVAGRLDPAEAQRAEYGFLSSTHRQRATIAKPGTMFVSQPEIPVPLVVEFPFPAWATRPSERGGFAAALPDAVRDALPDDPFDGIA